MNFITTTQLRTDSTRLVSSLKMGEKVSLIHRSQIIGIISPKEETDKNIRSGEELNGFLKTITPPVKITPKKRAKVYRKHLQVKYG